MKQTQIQEILDLSSLTMVDPEYTIFTRYILAGKYHSARIFLEGFIEDKESRNEPEEVLTSMQDYVDYCVKLDRLENLVLDLIISNEDVKHDKPKRARRRIVQ